MKTLTALAVLAIIGYGTQAQNVNIPDENFKDALLENTEINTVDDGEISEAEAAAFTGSIDVSNKSISDLTGIEKFTSLTGLQVLNNSLTTIDVSSNTALTSLGVGGNQLTSIDVSSNTALTSLTLNSNSLSSIDVSSNTNLTRLEVFGNSITSLDLSNNLELTNLDCGDNQLTTLDVSDQVDLEILNCNNNSLTTLDISSNTSLTSLGCQTNMIASLDLTKNTSLDFLNCSYNPLGDLNLTANGLLTYVICTSDDLTSLDLTNNTILERLYANQNELKSLDVSGLTALIELNVTDNELSSLTLTNGNNDQLTLFEATSNSGLHCISVDNETDFSDAWEDEVDNPDAITDEACVAITGVTINGEDDVTQIDVAGGTLQMEATVTPSDATYQVLSWSVDDETIATIDDDGLLTAVSDGEVKVKAETNDGSDLSAETTITVDLPLSVSNSGNSNLLEIFPNPAADWIKVSNSRSRLDIRIFTMNGSIILSEKLHTDGRLSLKTIPTGVYVISLRGQDFSFTSRLIIKK